MSQSIKTNFQSLASIEEELPNLAADLKDRGWDGILTLQSDRAISQAYMAPDGYAVFVMGSKSLFDRWNRQR